MTLRYEELRRRTEYSYLQAFGQLGAHVNRGRELGMRTLCVTDTSTLRYAYDLQKAAYVHTPDGEEQPRPIYGAVLNVVTNHRQHGLTKDDEDIVALGLEGRERQKVIRAEEARKQVMRSWDVTARVMEGNGFRSLSRLTSIAWDNDGGCYRGIPRVDVELLIEHNEGLSISFGGPDSLLGDHVIQGRMAQAARTAKKLAAAYKGRMYLELMPHAGPLHRRVNKAFIRIARALGLPLIAVNDVHYINADDTDAHTILLCLANKMTMEEPDHPRSPQGYHLRSGAEMMEAFLANHPYMGEELAAEVIEATVEVSDAHTYKMHIDRFKALVPQVPHDSSDDVAELSRLCAEGWDWRDIEGRSKVTGYSVAEYRARLDKELDVELRKAGKEPIACAKFPGYFLIVRDLINWCRDMAEPPIMTGPGRGSAAGSLVCYLLGITSLDPLEHGLLFERFISPERIDMPDIDMDFEDVRREEVITYLHEKWGRDKVSLICTVGRMKGKSALKDVGRVLGVPFGELNDVTGAIVERSSGDERASQTVADSFVEFKVCRDFNARHPHVLPLVVKLEGHARQPGVHAAGVITSPVPLPDVVPIETHMRNNLIVKLAAWDMYGVGGMGLLKLDILGLRTLTVLNDARKMAEKRNPGLKLDYELLPLDNPETLQAFTDHHYVGIFQYDSTGAHAACEGIAFDSFEDNVAMVALNRPGPARSGLATEFKKRKLNPKRRDERQVHPLYDSICSDSLGVLVYQEQVTKIFVQMAGYAPGTADSLRKVIAKKIGDETLKREREKFVAGAVERGVPADVAEKIISDITFFGCLTGETLIKTRHGSQRIDSLVNGQELVSWTPQGEVVNAIKVVEPTGVKTCIKITLDDGSSFACSLGHHWATPTGWLEARELVEGSLICSSTAMVIEPEAEGHEDVDRTDVFDVPGAAGILPRVVQSLLPASVQGVASRGRAPSGVLRSACRQGQGLEGWLDQGHGQIHRGAVQEDDRGIESGIHRRKVNGAEGCEGSGVGARQQRMREVRRPGGCEQPPPRPEGPARPSQEQDSGPLLGESGSIVPSLPQGGARGRTLDCRRVVSIEDIGFQATYDIEMGAAPATYILSESGIISHNSYGFNKSHSAAYAIIGYWQMWMKVHHPAELMWALMQNEPKREQIARYSKEAQRLGVEVQPPDINVSGVGFAINGDGHIVSNLTDIKYVGETATTAIQKAQPFTDMPDFFARIAGRAVNSRALGAMIKSGAMRKLLPNTRIALETIKEKGSWLDIGRKQKAGWEDALRELIADWDGEPDYDEEDLLYLAGEVSPLGGGKHPMAVYANLMTSALSGCRFTPIEEVWAGPSMPLIAGTMIDIKYNQVGDFDTVEPDAATKARMGWGKRYANVNIEDIHGNQVRVKVHQDNFPEFRWILDQGIGTSMAMRLLTWRGVKACRALYVVDLETMRNKGRHGLAWDGWEKCLTPSHPAFRAAKKGDVTRGKAWQRRRSFVACGLVISHKHIITKKTGQDMAFITLELADHSCLEVVVFPDSYADWGPRLKVGCTIRVDLKKDRKTVMLGDDGVIEVTSTTI